MFTIDLHITNFRLFIKISFEVEESAKPTQALRTILIQLVDKLQSYDSLVKIVKYKTEIQKCKQEVAVELKEVIKEVPSFIKMLKEYFWDIKTKGCNSRRVYTKMLMLHDIDLVNLIEIIKEDMNEF